MGSYPEMDGRLKPAVVHVFATWRTNRGFGGSNLLMVCCVSFQSVLLLKKITYELYMDVDMQGTSWQQKVNYEIRCFYLK